ncbi:hypothetical protein [Actinoplanes sp. NPDC049118]|uniref:hypothetical protein n=1 Tax=Actinoplanes sp. NPDC049118 TaxID=3155769 RepID=UPI0033D36905
MTRRTLLGTAGWIGAAVLAVLIGLAAVRVIGDGLTSEAGRPRSQAEIDRELAAHATTTPTSAGAPASAGPTAGTDPEPAPTTASAPPASASASAGSGPAPSVGLRSFRTRGGTVVARCGDRRAEIVAMSPLAGFAVHERDEGPRVQAEGEFRGTVDDHDRVKVRISCAGDRPVLAERSD